jgi:RNA polymerase sigma-70 factor (sigma-E family)
MVVRVAGPSFDEWATARVPSLLRFGYLVTGSVDAAEEAVQTALAQALASWDRVSGAGDPERYVRRMVANAHVSGWRAFGRRVSPVAEVREATDLVRDPSEAVARHDAVWRVCRALPERQRAAVVLRFYEDLDYPEIAATLGCAEATVRSQVHRALAALRVELERQEADDA